MSIEEKLSHKFIRTLKKRAYGWIAGNEAEGDFGDWEDWRKALVEFERKCRRTRRALDGAKAPRKSKRSAGSPRK